MTGRSLYGILDGILNEIVSVALLPRNDGILEFLLLEILRSSRGMTALGILDFCLLLGWINPARKCFKGYALNP